MDELEYYGWIDHQNIGDEALFEASKKLFNKNNILNEGGQKARNMLVGGGTVLPHLPIINNRCIEEYKKRYCIGVGVRDPQFWNRRMAWMDLPYFASKFGLEFSIIYDYLREYTPQMLKKAYTNSKSLEGRIEMSRNFLSNGDFENIRSGKFDKIGVRGPYSKRILDNFMIDSIVTGDPALYLEPTEYISSKTGRIGICLQHDTYKWARNKEYIPEVISFLDSISDKYFFIFLPMFPEDREINKHISNMYSGSEFVDYTEPMNVQEFIDVIANCDLILSEKLHGNILSASTYTPFISLEYRPKNFDFAASMGLEDYNIRIDRINQSKISHIFNKIIYNKKIKTKLKYNVNDKRYKLEQFRDDIVNDMK